MAEAPQSVLDPDPESVLDPDPESVLDPEPELSHRAFDTPSGGLASGATMSAIWASMELTCSYRLHTLCWAAESLFW